MHLTNVEMHLIKSLEEKIGGGFFRGKTPPDESSRPRLSYLGWAVVKADHLYENRRVEQIIFILSLFSN